MSPEQLQIGQAYYRVTYADPDLTVPGLEPMIYLGINIFLDSDPDRVTYHFQDTLSYSLVGNATLPRKEDGPFLEDELEGGIKTYSFSGDDLTTGLVDLAQAIVALQAALSRKRLLEKRE